MERAVFKVKLFPPGARFNPAVKPKASSPAPRALTVTSLPA
jgi:hypothetical protein